MKIVMSIIAAILFAIGLVALLSFDSLAGRLIALSPDSQISPFMLLRLKIVLISFLPVGLVLLFSTALLRPLKAADRWLASLSPGSFIIKALVAAFFLRTLAVLFYPFNLWIDYSAYDELARNLIQFGCYCIDGIPTAYRPPGYPVFVAGIYKIFGTNPHLAAAFNIIPSLIIMLFSYFIARRLFGERPARWTAIILTLFPSQILFCNLLASEILFTALMIVALYLIIKEDSLTCWIVVGIFLGLSVLVRPVSILLIVIPLIHFAITKTLNPRRLLLFVAAVLALLLAIFPWMYRNYSQKGTFTISTISGINLLAGNSPGAAFGWNPASVEGLPIGNPAKEAYVDSLARSRAFEYIKHDPAGFIKRGIMKTAYLFAVDLEGVDYQLKESSENTSANVFFIFGVLVQSYYLLISLFSIAGLLVMIKRGKWKETGVLWLIILYWIAVHFVFYAEGRYHFPIIPILAMYAAYHLTKNIEVHE